MFDAAVRLARSVLPPSSAHLADKTVFPNPSADPLRDSVALIAVALIFAAVTWAVQRWVLWPLARVAICNANYAVAETKTAESPTGLAAASAASIRQRRVPAGGQRPANAVQSAHAGTRALERKRTKFVVAATKMLSYAGLLGVAVWGLRGQEGWLFDPFQQHVSFAPPLPAGVRAVYLAETAYYVYTLVAMFWEPRMKDRPQMVAHHCFTLFLLITSWYWNAVKYGTCIVLLHDVSDPLMEAAKLFNYANIAAGSHLFFALFAASFFYLRVWIFPTRVIYATLANMNHYPFYPATFASLTGLWVLHVYWSYLICLVFYRNLILGDSSGDVREED